MTGLVVFLIVLSVGVLLLAGLVGSAYGKLTALRGGIANAFERVDEQLVHLHEEALQYAATGGPDLADTLGRSEEARRAAAASPGDPEAVGALEAAESALTAEMAGAAESGEGLLEGLTSRRDRIAFAEEAFAEAVDRFNSFRGRFSGRIVARLLGYPEARRIRIEGDRSPGGAGPDGDETTGKEG